MPSESPLFSIITVTYNAEDTVGTTLDSVNRQTFRNFEHIIVDGASTDGTLAVVAGCPSDSRRVISEPDRGIYDAMNKGICMAKGEYLIFLNAGDAFHSADTLETIASVAREADTPGVIYGQTQIVDKDGKRIADRHLHAPANLTHKSFAKGMVVCHQAFIPLARIAPLYDLRYRYSADYDWCIQCVQHSRKNVLIDDYLIDYLQEGVTTSNHKASLKERFKIMAYYYGTIPTILRHLSFIPRYVSRKMKNQKQ